MSRIAVRHWLEEQFLKVGAVFYFLGLPSFSKKYEVKLSEL
jgi:hypothetical protein